jgi:integrase
LIRENDRFRGTIIKLPSLGPNALSKTLVRRGEDAKLSQPVTWHDFRRTFAGNLLDSGAALVTVQKLMGQARPLPPAPLIGGVMKSSERRYARYTCPISGARPRE